jgi:GNAT superfamily N-acetyltransferase
VVCDNTGEIISFAKWRRPIPVSEWDIYVEVPWKWPEGTIFDVLEEWMSKVEEAGGELLGKTPCYCKLFIRYRRESSLTNSNEALSYIGTDQNYERLGAASMLVNWGLEHAKRENIPVALESTKNEKPFYEKLGFRGEQLIPMTMKGVGDSYASILYEEMCFLFMPHS